MRGSGKKPAVAILGTGSDFWLGRVHREDVFEISRACQREPGECPRSLSDPLRLFRLAGLGFGCCGGVPGGEA